MTMDGAMVVVEVGGVGMVRDDGEVAAMGFAFSCQDSATLADQPRTKINYQAK
jgi:hypothetical protein